MKIVQCIDHGYVESWMENFSTTISKDFMLEVWSCGCSPEIDTLSKNE